MKFFNYKFLLRRLKRTLNYYHFNLSKKRFLYFVLKTTCILFWRWPSVGVSVRTSRRWTTRSWAAACATTTTRTSSTRRRANATSTASCATCKACWERRRRRSWAAWTSHPRSPGGPRGPSTAPGRGGRSEDYGSEGSVRTCEPLKVKICSISGIKKLKVQQKPVNNTSAARGVLCFYFICNIFDTKLVSTSKTSANCCLFHGVYL